MVNRRCTMRFTGFIHPCLRRRGPESIKRWLARNTGRRRHLPVCIHSRLSYASDSMQQTRPSWTQFWTAPLRSRAVYWMRMGRNKPGRQRSKKRIKTGFSPFYTELKVGTPLNVCATKKLDSDKKSLNKLSNHRYLRFNIPTAGRYRLTIKNDTDTTVQPSIRALKQGKSIWGRSAARPGPLQIDSALEVGNYVAAVTQGRWPEEDTNDKCFNITLTQQ